MVQLLGGLEALPQTRVWFLASMADCSQTPATPAPEGSDPSGRQTIKIIKNIFKNYSNLILVLD